MRPLFVPLCLLLSTLYCATQIALSAPGPCKHTRGCQLSGACSSESGSCIAAKREDCLNSRWCLVLGQCSLVNRACVVAKREDCLRSRMCKEMGHCSLSQGELGALSQKRTCQASTDDDCSASRACTIRGQCTALNGLCEVTQSQSCEQSQECELLGKCSLVKGQCAVTNSYECMSSELCETSGRCVFKRDASGNNQCRAAHQFDCLRSKECREQGKCSWLDGRCELAQDLDCSSSTLCAQWGQCALSSGRCVVTQERHCRSSELCKRWGMCSLQENRCVVMRDLDCAHAEICKQRGRCSAMEGWCHRFDEADLLTKAQNIHPQRKPKWGRVTYQLQTERALHLKLRRLALSIAPQLRSPPPEETRQTLKSKFSRFPRLGGALQRSQSANEHTHQAQAQLKFAVSDHSERAQSLTISRVTNTKDRSITLLARLREILKAHPDYQVSDHSPAPQRDDAQSSTIVTETVKVSMRLDALKRWRRQLLNKVTNRLRYFQLNRLSYRRFCGNSNVCDLVQGLLNSDRAAHLKSNPKISLGPRGDIDAEFPIDSLEDVKVARMIMRDVPSLQIHALENDDATLRSFFSRLRRFMPSPQEWPAELAGVSPTHQVVITSTGVRSTSRALLRFLAAKALDRDPLHEVKFQRIYIDPRSSALTVISDPSSVQLSQLTRSTDLERDQADAPTGPIAYGYQLYYLKSQDGVIAQQPQVQLLKSDSGLSLLKISLRGASTAKRLAQLTQKNIRSECAISLGDEVYVVPHINEPIRGGKIEISLGSLNVYSTDWETALGLMNHQAGPDLSYLKVISSSWR